MILAASLHSEDFAGRREELAFLHEEYRTACESGARFVTIEGEAGIGKSRLLQELIRSAPPHSAANGACLEQIRSPYLAWTEILEHLDPRRSWFPHAEQKSAFFGAVADAMRRRCARGPLIVTIEDLQWADGATLELLGFLLARLGKVPVLILLTMRSEPYPALPALAAFRSAASRKRSASLQLRPLRRNDVRNLVQQTLSRRGLWLPSRTIAQIEVLAEGNPLFAEELVRAALENGELSMQPHMPVSVAAILSERLSAFDESERGLLMRAAILGQIFDIQMLAGITGTSEIELAFLMQRCADRGLIVEDPNVPLRFRFKHALIRKALADRLVVALAAPLHVRIASALESLGDDASRTAELAYHWSASRNAEKARIWNERAAEQAWSMYAYRDAIRFYSEALRWEYPAGRERARLFERLGTLHYIDGSAEEPAHFFERCRSEYEQAGDEEDAARAIWLLADQRWVDARTVDALHAATEASARAQRLGNVQLQAGTLLSMARFAGTLGKPEEALAHIRAAEQFVDESDQATCASLFEIRGETLAVQGHTNSALADLRRAADLAGETGSPELIAQIENNFALGASDLGELDLALTRHRRALEEADRTAMMWRVAYCSLSFARTLMLKGDLDAARRHVWSALETGVSTATFKTKASAVGIPLALMLNDIALLESCAREEALELARQSGEAQRIASVSAAFAELRSEQGSASEARALIADALVRVSRAHRSWDLLLAAARYGNESDVTMARMLFAGAFGRPRVRRAYLLLFDSIVKRDNEPEASARHAQAAKRQFQLMGDALHAAQSLELSGEREAAIAAYSRLRSIRDVQRLEVPAASEPRRDLTPRQMEIAELVALGETNREIAATLHISEHTVEHHVSAIFERLELRSRAQLAHAIGKAERI